MNFIKFVKDGGIIFTDQEAIKKVFLKHFSNFFSSKGDDKLFNLESILVNRLSILQATGWIGNF